MKLADLPCRRSTSAVLAVQLGDMLHSWLILEWCSVGRVVLNTLVAHSILD